MKEEIWKAIPGYEGLYEVSNFGNIRRAEDIVPDTYLICKVIPPKELPYSNSGAVVLVDSNRKKKGYQLEWLVAKTFLPESKNKFVTFLDGNKNNRRADNLAWSDKRSWQRQDKKDEVVAKVESLDYYVRLSKQIAPEYTSLYEN